MTARMIKPQSDPHRYCFCGRAFDAKMEHAAADDRFALAFFQYAGAQFHLPIDGHGFEIVDLEGAGHKCERRRPVVQSVARFAAIVGERGPDRVAIDHRGDGAAVYISGMSDVIRLGLPVTQHIVAFPSALDLQAVRVERTAAEAVNLENILQWSIHLCIPPDRPEIPFKAVRRQGTASAASKSVGKLRQAPAFDYGSHYRSRAA
jgi:hypothetical protein